MLNETNVAPARENPTPRQLALASYSLRAALQVEGGLSPADLDESAEAREAADVVSSWLCEHAPFEEIERADLEVGARRAAAGRRTPAVDLCSEDRGGPDDPPDWDDRVQVLAEAAGARAREAAMGALDRGATLLNVLDQTKASIDAFLPGREAVAYGWPGGDEGRRQRFHELYEPLRIGQLPQSAHGPIACLVKHASLSGPLPVGWAPSLYMSLVEWLVSPEHSAPTLIDLAAHVAGRLVHWQADHEVAENGVEEEDPCPPTVASAADAYIQRLGALEPSADVARGDVVDAHDLTEVLVAVGKHVARCAWLDAREESRPVPRVPDALGWDMLAGALGLAVAGDPEQDDSRRARMISSSSRVTFEGAYAAELQRLTEGVR